MKRLAALALATVIVPHVASAQVQPHRAEYLLRFGVASNAPRIGSAIQDLASDCSKWRIKRDIKVRVPLTPSWNISAASMLDGEEQRNGEAFDYHALQTQDDSKHDTRGKVQRKDKATSVEISSAGERRTVGLPAATLLPVAALNRLIERLRAGAASASLLIFAGETSEAYQIDVEKLTKPVRAAPHIDNAPQPSKNYWPVRLVFRRTDQPRAKPLFSMSGNVFETGILDRLTIDASGFTVAADLQSLEMRAPVACSPRR